MAVRTETIQLTGVRCERCVLRLGAALKPLEGIEHANANLLGELTVAWDDAHVDRPAIVAALAQAGFREVAPV